MKIGSDTNLEKRMCTHKKVKNWAGNECFIVLIEVSDCKGKIVNYLEEYEWSKYCVF